jgi:hypothetical protein
MPWGAAEPLEPIFAQVSRRDAVDLVTGQGPDRRLTDNHVPAVRDLADPRRAVDLEANVTLVPDPWLTGMEAHPDAYGKPVRPRSRCVPSLCRDDGA